VATHLNYWDYDPDASIDCPACDWRGRARDHQDYFDALLDVRCPKCDRMILIVSYPTIAETRAAAAAGNERAQAELPNVNTRERFLERAKELELKGPDQLPPLTDQSLQIVWDFEEREGENWTVLRHGDREIWREIAYYEGYERFKEVFEILLARYGSRLVEVRPTRASEIYLYGDKLSAPDGVDRLNRSLARRSD